MKPTYPGFPQEADLVPEDRGSQLSGGRVPFYRLEDGDMFRIDNRTWFKLTSEEFNSIAATSPRTKKFPPYVLVVKVSTADEARWSNGAF